MKFFKIVAFLSFFLVSFFGSIEAQAKPRLSNDQQVAYAMMATAEMSADVKQHRIDIAREFCQRNGGTFDMNKIVSRENSNIDVRIRDRDRGVIYRRGRSTVISPLRLLFNPRPEVEIRADLEDDLRIPDDACVYPEVPKPVRR